MPTQKVFKQRVRARMTKTGESYTAARRQLLHKAAGPGAAGRRRMRTPRRRAEVAEPSRRPAAIPPMRWSSPTTAMLRATGRRHAEWFALLDAWGAHRAHATPRSPAG